MHKPKPVAAIYARVSVARDGVAHDAKSTTRQVAEARRFAVGRFDVQDDLIFVDDGFSGAEFRRRPAFQRMLRAAEARQFTSLLISEAKSLGRESVEVAHTIKRLKKWGVEVFGYMDGASLTPHTALAKGMSAMRSLGDELHREDTSKRVFEAHAVKARAGFVVGSRVFGYKNRHVYVGVDAHGNPARSHVDREIDPAEARQVLRVFEMYAAGVGIRGIAKTLNAEIQNAKAAGTAPPPAPMSFKGRPQRFTAAMIRSMTTRSLYAGRPAWAATRKRDDDGERLQRARPPEDLIVAVREDLRIIPEDLWAKVQAQRGEREKRTIRFRKGGTFSGRPRRDGAQYLLTGMAECSVCHGGMVVERRPTTRGKPPVHELMCRSYRRGDGCTNSLRVPIALVDEAVLYAMEVHALTPEAIASVVRQADERAEEAASRTKTLEREKKSTLKQIDNLVDALASGGSKSITSRIAELEARVAAIDREVASARPFPRLNPRAVRDRLDEWRRMLRGSIEQARATLHRLIDGRIVFTPRDGCYDFEATTKFDDIMRGVAFATNEVPVELRDSDPAVFVDPYDEDRRQLLNVQRVASPTGFEPVFWP
jgi:site-specific DNA recombinase